MPELNRPQPPQKPSWTACAGHKNVRDFSQGWKRHSRMFSRWPQFSHLGPASSARRRRLFNTRHLRAISKISWRDLEAGQAERTPHIHNLLAIVEDAHNVREVVLLDPLALEDLVRREVAGGTHSQ